MKILLAPIAALGMTACGLMAQTPTMSCDRQGNNDRQRSCEIRETAITASALTVDGHQNGGISIKGGDRSGILVRAMVQSEDPSTAAQVIVHTAGGAIQADGPAQGNWSVSYEILVPRNTALTLKTHNGGVAITGVESTVEFHAVNGGISLNNVGGDVHGDTVNGGISVRLAGARWSGQGLDVTTNNGGVSMKVPGQFSALLDVATVNGGMKVSLPNAQITRGDHHLSLTLGTGGPLLRIRTHNGGVSISDSAT